jgi:hypothetical protein
VKRRCSSLGGRGRGGAEAGYVGFAGEMGEEGGLGAEAGANGRGSGVGIS